MNTKQTLQYDMEMVYLGQKTPWEPGNQTYGMLGFIKFRIGSTNNIYKQPLAY